MPRILSRCLRENSMKNKLEKSVSEIAKDRKNVIDKLVNFSLTDMLLFWGGNEELFKQQEKKWLPVLIWAKDNLDAKFKTTQNLDVPEQESQTGVKLKKFLESLSDKELTAFYWAALNMRSVLLAAALVKGKINAQQAFEASCLEELWQAKKWGSDEVADCRRNSLKQELEQIEAFIG